METNEKTDNELIAEFMGMTYCETEHDRFWHPTEQATTDNWKYHSLDLDHFYPKSWDWLMPVVKKIGDMMTEFETKPFYELDEAREILVSLGDCLCQVNIAVANVEVVNWIKWYKANKK